MKNIKNNTNLLLSGNDILNDDLFITEHYNTRIRYARIYRGVEQKELAEHLGMKKQQYHEYEIGLHLMPIKYLKPIAQYLNITTDFILNLTNEIEQNVVVDIKHI